MEGAGSMRYLHSVSLSGFSIGHLHRVSPWGISIGRGITIFGGFYPSNGAL